MMIRGVSVVLAAVCMLTAWPAVAVASCEVVYQYNEGPLQALTRHRVSLRLAAGERREISQTRLDFVANTGQLAVVLRLSGAPHDQVRLEPGQQNPDRRLGYYFGPRPVTLQSIDCPAG